MVIGTEWDQGQQKESYWIRFHGRCRLVPSENMRYATMEECLSRDKVIEEIKASLTSMSEEKQPFSFDDDRKASPPGMRRREAERAESLQEPPDTPVGEQEPVSMEEAMKKFFAGQAPFPYVGDTPKTSAFTQLDNRVQADNLVGHDSHAPAPSMASEPIPECVEPSDTELEVDRPEHHVTSAPEGTSLSGVERTQESSAEGQIGADEVEALYANVSNKERQQVFYVQGKPSMLVVDHGSNECFLLKCKTFKNNQRKGR